VDATIQAFDDTVHKILRKDFTHRSDSSKTCSECDFRFYCDK
jgi:DNA helicase-2/ATP-dependent DNA helicase PcrA